MITIRALRKDDEFNDLIVLSHEFFSEYETHHAEFFKIDELMDEDVTTYFLSFCGQDTRNAFIALEDARIVGYITTYIKDQADYWQTKKVGEISGLMVQKDYRRRGIAERLLAQAKAFFMDKGIRFYTVYTAVTNQAALDFYQKNGLMPLYTTMLGETQAIPIFQG